MRRGTGPRWWYYTAYTICCDQPPPPFTVFKTAYAKGGYVWTTNKRANPESLPSLNLTQNRWGWAIQLPTTGTFTFDIWMGAGLNNTANGVKVGTATIVWDGSEAQVSYDLFPGYGLSEVHVYAGDTAPQTIAPGQYGFIAEPLDGDSEFDTELAVPDTNLDGKAWFVLHAVVGSY